MDGLTSIQDSCLRALDRYVKQEGRSPTRRELVELAGQKSTNGINQILAALVKKAYIKLDPPNRPRNIKVLRVPTRQLAFEERLGLEQRHRPGGERHV